jgi:3-deoxy-D-manno-octulosonic-acid transferase
MSFSLLLYNALLLVGLVWGWPIILLWLALNPKTRAGLGAKWGVYPTDFLARLATQRQSQQPQLWFHAVSVGEFNAIKSLVADLKDQFAITITTTTLTGQTLAQQTFPDLPITYFPLDFRPVLHHAVHNMRPDLVILTETELWPNAVDVIARSHQIPVFLINGRISATSFKGYQRFKPLMGPLLRQIKHLFMQSEADANRVLALGAEAKNITVAGNIKFDLNPTIDDAQLATLKACFNFGERDTVMVCASTHTGEDAPLLQAYLTLRKDFPELKLILAPRHPERRAEIRNLLQSQGVSFSLRSQLNTEHPNTTAIVVLDSIGELLATYRLSHLAIMGGSFIAHGGQNPLEPISQSIPVIFGPYMFNFAQITKLIRENHVGLQIESPDGVVDAVTQLLTQPEVYQAMVLRGQKILQTNRGAKAILQNAITQHFAPQA